ncbi:hypothetical protein ES708_33367 [subsurface metagenome]
MPPSGRSGYNGYYSDPSYIIKQRRARFKRWHPDLNKLKIEALLNIPARRNTTKLGHHANKTSFKKGQVSPAKGIKRLDVSRKNKLTQPALVSRAHREGKMRPPKEYADKIRRGVLKAYEEGRLVSSFGKLNRDPQFIAKQIVARGVKPSRIELKLEDILNRNFPNQYEYTGDGKLIINGMVPDFCNKDGKKDLIELYGDYWHSPEVTQDNWRRTELGRIMAYNSLGYHCLVIWECQTLLFPTRIELWTAHRDSASVCRLLR